LGREPAWDEPGGPLGPVPRLEVLDDRLRMDGRARVCLELAHRGRPAEPLRARSQLVQDVLVAVPLAHPGLELLQLVAIDALDRAVHRLASHEGSPGSSGRVAAYSICSRYCKWTPAPCLTVKFGQWKAADRIPTDDPLLRQGGRSPCGRRPLAPCGRRRGDEPSRQ